MLATDKGLALHLHRSQIALVFRCGVIGMPTAIPLRMMNSAFPIAHPPVSNDGPDSNVDTILTLPRGTGALAIAAACRDTALAFLNEAEHWGKAELAMWLMGPYAQATQYAPDISSRKSGEFVRTVPLLREIDARMVDRVIRSARSKSSRRSPAWPTRKAQRASHSACSRRASSFAARIRVTLQVGFRRRMHAASPIASSRSSLPIT